MKESIKMIIYERVVELCKLEKFTKEELEDVEYMRDKAYIWLDNDFFDDANEELAESLTDDEMVEAILERIVNGKI